MADVSRDYERLTSGLDGRVHGGVRRLRPLAGGRVAEARATAGGYRGSRPGMCRRASLSVLALPNLFN